MKTITDAIKRLSKEKIKELASLLMLKKADENAIISRITSYSGLDKILTGLSLNELQMLQLVYSNDAVITLGEIEKKLEINIAEVEKTANGLAGKLMLYIIKNRQLLSNKLDKIYGIEEIASIINITGISTIHEELAKISASLEQTDEDEAASSTVLNNAESNIKQILIHLAESGGIVSLEDFQSYCTKEPFDSVLSTMLEQKLISMCQVITPRYHTVILVDEKIAPAAAHLVAKKETKDNRVHNRFHFLLNTFNAFDVISTYGMFLTKQGKFRIIDEKRIMESQRRLQWPNGKYPVPEEVLRLTLFFLNRLGCLKLDKDIANITLAPIQNQVEEPENVIITMMKVLDSTEPVDPYFLPPFEMPSYDSILSTLKILSNLKKPSFTYLKITELSRFLGNSPDEDLENDLHEVDAEYRRFKRKIDFLCLTGIIEIIGNRIQLSDIGKEIVARELKTDIRDEEQEIKKTIYINPDFTIIIPEEDIPSRALFNILTYTEIVKDDVILHATIDKSSIIKAHKLGLSVDRFVTILEEYSKNEIPQNLNFLLTEWSNQAITLKISREILLKINNPSFLDEIEYNKTTNMMIERISSHYAIVNKEYIDDIIKLARKNDAVISLFEEKTD
ncbi:MAG: hypothetical protein GY754_10520 [bacterium]|nr:hypothetical protein [bacterium]